MTNSKRTIGKLAAEAGVGVETIRYYERRGLLQQPPRHGIARNYGDEALWRLRYIKVGQQWGLSLREMRNLLTGAERSPNFCSSIRAAAAQRIEAIEHQIAELKAAGGWRVSAVREQTSATTIRDIQCCRTDSGHRHSRSHQLLRRSRSTATAKWIVLWTASA